MADEPPPRLAGPEPAAVRTLLAYQRASFVRKVSGLSDEDARSSPLPSGTSLLWLTNHMADAETIWVLRRFAGRPADPVEDAHEATIGAAIERYRTRTATVDAVLDGHADLDVRCPPFDARGDVDLRWILVHLVEETARHAGHADVLRELLDGAVGR